jgi:hypothetical protein
MPTMQPKTQDVEVVDEEQVELVPYEPTPAASGLFGTDDPELVVARAAKVADALERVVREKKLVARIRSNEHVLVEGWTLLGSMLGVFPVLVWTHKLDDGWEARVEARTMAGAVVGAAESECLRSESRWAKADDYAIRSMAATRATSKALRQPLGFVMTMAGLEPTPAEEMPAEPEPPRRSRVAPVAAEQEQLAEIGALIRTLQESEPEVDWRAKAQEIAGVPADMLTKTVAEILIGKLREQLASLAMPAE